MSQLRRRSSRARSWTLVLAFALGSSALTSCDDGGDGQPPPGSQAGADGEGCQGENGCACYPNGTCNASLICRSGSCEEADAGDGGANHAAGSGGTGNDAGATDGGSSPGSTAGSSSGGGSSGSGGSGGSGVAGDGSGGADNVDPIDYVDPLAGSLEAKTVSLYSASTGTGHGCISTESGDVYCWGRNNAGQLGNGTDYASATPAKVNGISTAEKVVTGDQHSCALLTDGTVRCWGDNNNFVLGTGDQIDAWEPVQPTGLSGVVDIASRSSHSCAARDDGAVLCWGWSGKHLGYSGLGSVPKSVGGLAGKAEAVAVGDALSCALIEDGTVQCWGNNRWGQLGHDNMAAADSQAPVKVKGLDSVVALSAGSSHICAVKAGGTVWCWGYGLAHQLGKNVGTHSYAPSQVLGVDDATTVGAGLQHTCATRKNGKVTCWGQNDYGEAGTGTTATVLRAWDDVPGIDDAVQVWAGTYSTCALLQGGAVQCWGDNQGSRIALGDLAYSLVHRTPAGFRQGGKWFAPSSAPPRTGAGNIAQVVAGTGRSCVLRTGGKVDCWGDNYAKLIGDGQVDPVLAPTEVTALADATQLTDFGGGQICARKADGNVVCRGSNAAPVRMNSAVFITNGYDFGCAILDGLAVQCWGNDFGHTLTLSRGAIDVTAGSNHACAVIEDGRMHCWGYFDEASLGSNQPGLQSLPYEPSDVQGVTGATQASAGLSHTCALVTGGRVKCWGANNDGQLGQGTGMYSRLPVDIGLSSVTQIDSGWYHSCAVTAAGKVLCWGNNAFGQIGNDDVGDALAPAEVVGIVDAVQVACGQEHTCALHRDGKLSCWGRNESGQLGDGTTEDSPVPVLVVGL